MTDRIILHKRFITVREPIEVTGGVSVIQTTFDEDLNFYTVLLDRYLQVNDQSILTLNYVGELKNDKDGFYLSSYIRSSDKVRRYLVASQMEPIAARRAVPCFDEPALKATFTMTVEHEQQYRVWSNMPIKNHTIQSNGWILTQFQRSVPMSSYLLALVVADFDCLTQNNTGRFGNITTNVCGQARMKDGKAKSTRRIINLIYLLVHRLQQLVYLRIFFSDMLQYDTPYFPHLVRQQLHHYLLSRRCRLRCFPKNIQIWL